MARIAKSLDTLRAQINAMAPNRSKASDGWIGDVAHQATKSDHNPNAAGVVNALDITHDPAHGVDARKLAETLVASRDKRISYIISNGEIINSQVQKWQWRPYGGKNPHRAHVHISVLDDPALYDDPSPWIVSVKALPPDKPVPQPAPVLLTELRQRMAQCIVDYEARRDAMGRIMVFNPPANDGGGAYEVAGINVRFHPAKAAELKALVERGRHQEAEAKARDYVLSYTQGVTMLHGNPGVEFYLRDCAFNRGPTGAVKILQMAVGVLDDGIVGPRTKQAVGRLSALDLLGRLRASREAYELKVAGRRENLWDGLVNRWNKAHAQAQKFLTEVPVVSAPKPAEPAPKSWFQKLVDAIFGRTGT